MNLNWSIIRQRYAHNCIINLFLMIVIWQLTACVPVVGKKTNKALSNKQTRQAKEAKILFKFQF